MRIDVVSASKDESPFKRASLDCMTLLVHLTLSRELVRDILTQTNAQCPAPELKWSAKYRRLAELARLDKGTGCLVDEHCQARYNSGTQLTKHCPLYEMTCRWSQIRRIMNLRSAAALLWEVSRAQPSYYRKLECVMVNELTHLALGELGSDKAVPGHAIQEVELNNAA